MPLLFIVLKALPSLPNAVFLSTNSRVLLQLIRTPIGIAAFDVK
jgi:hypothetical protein